MLLFADDDSKFQATLKNSHQLWQKEAIEVETLHLEKLSSPNALLEKVKTLKSLGRLDAVALSTIVAADIRGSRVFRGGPDGGTTGSVPQEIEP